MLSLHLARPAHVRTHVKQTARTGIRARGRGCTRKRHALVRVQGGGGGADQRDHCGVDRPTGNDAEREVAHQDRNTRISL